MPLVAPLPADHEPAIAGPQAPAAADGRHWVAARGCNAGKHATS